MKRAWIAACLIACLGTSAFSQTTQPTATPPPAAPAAPPVADDARPAPSNVAGQQFPKVDSQGRATFRLNAPNAQKVSVTIGRTHEMTKGDDGAWTVTTGPLVAGFHYYTLNVDGVSVADPASETFFGVSRMMSGLEVPDKQPTYYDAKNVPHGEIRSRFYHTKSTGQLRQAFVYTPPDYDTNPSARYPVLYLQHGMGEDRRGWSQQGRTHFILDNLIAEGKAKPMIIVMDDGGIAGGMGGRGGGGRGGRRGGPPPGAAAPALTPDGTIPVAAPAPPTPSATPPATPPEGRRGFGGGGRGGRGMGGDFAQILISDIIPMIDATYRTKADREHRAMAGLSMGGTQTFAITQANLDKFSHIGVFSAPFGFPDVATGYNGLLQKPDEFAKQVKVLYVSVGTAEGTGGARGFHAALEGAGIKHTYFESQGTAHDWNTWRRSLHGFAPLLFQN